MQPGSRTQSPNFVSGVLHTTRLHLLHPLSNHLVTPFFPVTPLTLLFLPPFTVVPSPSRPRSLFASLPLSTAPASGTCDFPPPLVASPFVSTLLRSSRSYQRGKRHFDFPWFSQHCEATSAPSFPGLDVRHFGYPPFSFSDGCLL